MAYMKKLLAVLVAGSFAAGAFAQAAAAPETPMSAPTAASAAAPAHTAKKAKVAKSGKHSGKKHAKLSTKKAHKAVA